MTKQSRMRSGTVELDVQPDYGWGWTDDKGGIVETPPAFKMIAEAKEPEGRFVAVGLLDQPDHLLHGLWVAVTQRHTEWTGTCNIAACYERPDDPINPTAIKYAGFAQVREI